MINDFSSLPLHYSYDSGEEDILWDFYIPVLSKANRYDRIAGFFSSSSLAFSARGMEAFLNNDAQTFHGCAGGIGNGNKTLQGAAVCQEVIDDQNVIIGCQELFGYNDLVAVFVGEGVHFCHIHFTINIDGF